MRHVALYIHTRVALRIRMCSCVALMNAIRDDAAHGHAARENAARHGAATTSYSGRDIVAHMNATLSHT